MTAGGTHYVLSLGAGVNSTALLILLLKKKMPLDEVVFADTGAELPETYAMLQTIRAYLRSYGVPLRIVDPKTTLLETCRKRRVTPSKMWRWQTRDKKVTPIHAHYRNLGKAAVVEYIGIGADEKRRAKPSPKKDAWVVKSFPLIEWGLGRSDCVRVIQEAGLSVPPKSGCFFCPFKKEEDWVWLLNNHPDLYEVAMNLEEQSKYFPKQTLFPGGLRNLAEGSMGVGKSH